jgi:hypothetical protein
MEEDAKRQGDSFNIDLKISPQNHSSVFHPRTCLDLAGA